MSISSNVGEIKSALNDYCKVCSEDAIPRIEGYLTSPGDPLELDLRHAVDLGADGPAGVVLESTVRLGA